MGPALRHRILLNYNAEAEHGRPDEIIQRIREEIGDIARVAESRSVRPPGPISRLLKIIADPSPTLRKKS